MTTNTSTVSTVPTVIGAAGTALVTHVKECDKNDRQAPLKFGAYVSEVADSNAVTADTLAHHVNLLVSVAFPNVKPDSRAASDSKEGKAHNCRNKFRRGLTRAAGIEAKAKAPAAPVMRVTLTGEDGGTVVIAPDSPHYAVLAALISGATPRSTVAKVA